MSTSYSQPDIWMTPITFNTTEVQFVAVTPNGIALLEQCFGHAARQATMPRSRAGYFMIFAKRANVVIMEARAENR